MLISRSILFPEESKANDFCYSKAIPLSCKTHGPLWFIILINSVTADVLSFFCDGVMRLAEIKLGQVKKRHFLCWIDDWWSSRENPLQQNQIVFLLEKKISMKSIQVNFLCFYLLSFFGKGDNSLPGRKHLIFIMINDRISFKAELDFDVYCLARKTTLGFIHLLECHKVL